MANTAFTQAKSYDEGVRKPSAINTHISITCIKGPWQYTITIMMVLRNTIMSIAFLQIEIKINLERSIGTYNTEQEIILRYSI